MVWAGIHLNGKTRLVFVDGNLNHRRYIDEILTPVAVPYLQQMGPNATLQQDNVRPHTARVVNTFLINMDLTQIEHVWDQLGRAVHQRLTPQHKLRHVRQFLQEEWDRLAQANFRTLA